MKSFIAFFKKEIFECIRSGELTFFCILFLIFGIMNPAIAKLTPWMLETLSVLCRTGNDGYQKLQ